MLLLKSIAPPGLQRASEEFATAAEPCEPTSLGSCPVDFDSENELRQPAEQVREGRHTAGESDEPDAPLRAPEVKCQAPEPERQQLKQRAPQPPEQEYYEECHRYLSEGASRYFCQQHRGSFLHSTESDADESKGVAWSWPHAEKEGWLSTSAWHQDTYAYAQPPAAYGFSAEPLLPPLGAEPVPLAYSNQGLLDILAGASPTWSPWGASCEPQRLDAFVHEADACQGPPRAGFKGCELDAETNIEALDSLTRSIQVLMATVEALTMNVERAQAATCSGAFDCNDRDRGRSRCGSEPLPQWLDSRGVHSNGGRVGAGGPACPWSCQTFQ